MYELLVLSAELLQLKTTPVMLASKVGAVVAGQTSVKTPEKAAFENYLPEDVHIVSCHSLHGPTVNPVGQPLVSLHLTPFKHPIADSFHRF